MNKFLRVLLMSVVAIVFGAVSLMPSDAAARQVKRRHSSKGRKASVKKPYVVSAKAALLMEMGSGRKIYTKSMTRKVIPASTTKVLTAMLTLERLNLDDYVTISPRAASVLPSKIYAQVGDKYRVRDLLYAALLNSANDASVALAEAVAGSEDRFVKLMNRRSLQIGAHSTLFANAHGLPADDPQYSTAYDMALIFREAMKKPFFVEAIKKRYYKIVSQKGRVTLLKSHNKCLFKEWKKDVYGKTGYTRAAQACFVGYVEKGGKKYIVAVFRCSRRWDDIKFIIERHAGIDL